MKKETTEKYIEEEKNTIEEDTEKSSESEETLLENSLEVENEETDEKNNIEETENKGEPNKFDVLRYFKKIKEFNGFKEFKGLPLYLAIAVFAIAIALIVILLLPSTQSKRALKKADAKYTVEAFSEAVPLYEKSFTLKKDNVKAYLGYLLSKKALGSEDAKEKYLSTYEALKEINVSDGDLGVLKEIYLLAPEILADDYEKTIEVLEYAMDNLEESDDLRNPLSDAYFKAGMEKKDSNVSDALLMFDKALELSDNAESMIFDISEVVLTQIRIFLGSDDFEAARTCLSKYGDTLKLDVASEESLIADAESIYDTKLTLLTDVYNAIEPYYTSYKDSFAENFPSETEPVYRAFLYDWSRMMEIDGSFNAETVANSKASESYCFSPGGFSADFTGTACGVYTFGDEYVDAEGNSTVSYYFYFGDYKDGKRNGYGITFIKTDATSCDVFEGNWVDDKPEGFGAYYNNNMYAYTSLAEIRMLSYGNFSAGIQNGEMTAIAVLNEHPDTYFKSTYTAQNGYVEPLSGEPIEHGIVSETPEGYNLVATIASVTDGYDYFVPIYVADGSLLGVYGFI